jgi:hypothetical protein
LKFSLEKNLFKGKKMEALTVPQQDFSEDCDEATKRLTDLMQEYLAIKKVEREVRKYISSR